MVAEAVIESRSTVGLGLAAQCPQRRWYTEQLAFDAGRFDDVERHARDPLPLGVEMDDRRQILFALAMLAAAAGRLGQRERARRLWGAVEAEDAGAGRFWQFDRERITAHIPEPRLVVDVPSLDEAVAEALGDAKRLPGGTVTFLFTDIEGSTRLLHELGRNATPRRFTSTASCCARRSTCTMAASVDTQGDAFFVAFSYAPRAPAAASRPRRHSRWPDLVCEWASTPASTIFAEEGYVGADVHRAARICRRRPWRTNSALRADGALVGSPPRSRPRRAPAQGSFRSRADLPARRRRVPAAGHALPNHFPIPVTPFLGREHELTEVVDLVGRQDVRLVTLTGPGGTGKTRLGSQAAEARADRYPGGVCWVPLAPLRDPGSFLSRQAGQSARANGLRTTSEIRRC